MIGVHAKTCKYSNGWCLNAKRLLNGTLYYQHAGRVQVQLHLYIYIVYLFIYIYIILRIITINHQVYHPSQQKGNGFWKQIGHSLQQNDILTWKTPCRTCRQVIGCLGFSWQLGSSRCVGSFCWDFLGVSWCSLGNTWNLKGKQILMHENGDAQPFFMIWFIIQLKANHFNQSGSFRFLVFLKKWIFAPRFKQIYGGFKYVSF